MAKAIPKGVKHRHCVEHVQHTYPKAGWLCVNKSNTPTSMVEFADIISAIRAARTAEWAALHALSTAKWRKAYLRLARQQASL